MKVYVVSYGAYSDHYVDTVFAARELAETYVVERARRERPETFIERDSVDTYEKWRSSVGGYGLVGYIDEFELWDMVPIVRDYDDYGVAILQAGEPAA